MQLAVRHLGFSTLSLLALGSAPDAQLLDPVAGWVNWTAGERTGAAVDRVGDVDGDGVFELAVGSPNADWVPPFGVPITSEAGRVELFSGTELSLEHELPSGESAVDGERFGTDVAGAPSLGGLSDYPGVLCGAPGHVDASGEVRGGASLYTFEDNGTLFTGVLLEPLLMHVFEGTQDGQQFGASVASVGDLTGDGEPEFVIGAPGHDIALSSFATMVDVGRAVVVSADGSTLDFVGGLLGAGSALGSALCGPGDLDLDGVPDFAVGVPKPAVAEGSVRLYSGATRELLFQVSHTGAGASSFGAALAASGDVDLDGVPDFAIGDPAGAGLVQVRSGADGALLAERAEVGGTGLGAALAGMGDADGDGVPDLAVARSQDDELCVLRASDLAETATLSLEGLDDAPAALAAADLDGDGTVEVVCGLPLLDGERGGLVVAVLADGPAPGKHVVVVDDDGGADFREIAHATLLAPHGSVVKVLDGDYAGFTAGRAMHLVGPAAGSVVVEEGAVVGADEFTIAGPFEFTAGLALEQVPGRVHVDDCVVRGVGLEVVSCDQVLIERTACWPEEILGGGFTVPEGYPALRLTLSRVTLVDCDLRGANGQGALYTGSSGGAGVQILSGSTLLAAGCDLRGGHGDPNISGAFGLYYGVGGAGVEIEDDAPVPAEVDVRGSSPNVVEPGLGASDLGAILFDATEGHLVTASGVTLGGASDAVWLDPARPYLVMGGDDTPGGAGRSLDYHGALGVPAVVVVSLGTDLLDFGVFEGGSWWLALAPIWQSLILFGQGQDTAVPTNLPIPANPNLVGAGVHVQGVMVDGALWVLTNPSSLVVHH